MTATPRLSIGMPVFNGEAYLAEALDSLLGQTYTDFELIISDNHSDDATEAICRDCAARDPRIRYFRGETNRGAAWNHNKVIRESRGELFKLACYDDVCAPTMVEACVRALDGHPGAVLAYTDTCMMTKGDMSALTLYQSDMALSSPLAAVRFGDLIDEAPPAFPIFGVVRAAALRRTPLFESYKAGDRVVLARLALLGPFVKVPELLFYYRWHDQNASHLMSDPAAFYRWWEPGKGNGKVFPETRLLWEYVRSLWLLPLPLKVRLACAREIRLWYQGNKKVIHWELGRLLPGRRPAAPPRRGFVERLARRARRKEVKKRLYGLES